MMEDFRLKHSMFFPLIRISVYRHPSISEISISTFSWALGFVQRDRGFQGCSRFADLRERLVTSSFVVQGRGVVGGGAVAFVSSIPDAKAV